MRVLDLFSGIGGFSLGLERAGMRTVAFCEIDPYARAVIAKHWPGIPCYDDVRALTGERLRTDGIVPDVICGGFPCQDLSLAGGGAGIDGQRSGLWREFARLIGEIRPSFVIVENVAALLGRGLGRVLGDLAALGYDAEWNCIPASAIGAPHRRDRIWIVAHPSVTGSPDRNGKPRRLSKKTRGVEFAGLGRALANPNHPRLEIKLNGKAGQRSAALRNGGAWTAEPDVGRVAHGVSNRVDRLKCLGNAVVPQIPQIIGEAIMFYEQKSK